MNAKSIIETLEEEGYEAYYIGGCVRDHLLGKPSNDIDIVTSARPSDIINIFPSQNTKLVGKSFGVVIVNDIEVATFRRDIYPDKKPYKKKPAIAFASSLSEDIKRRDFTINTIAMDARGNIIDLLNGRRDLEDNIIKFVGVAEDRIREDPVRILRACRFISLLDGEFSPVTRFSLEENTDLLRHVALERIGIELMKAIVSLPKPSRFFQTCLSIGVLKGILPSLSKCMAVSQNKFHDETLFMHHMLVGDAISPKFPLVRLTGYLHDVGKVQTKKYDKEKKDFTFHKHNKVSKMLVTSDLKRLKFSNDDIAIITGLIYLHMRQIPRTPKAKRRLLRSLQIHKISYRSLLRLFIADRKGRISSHSKPFSIREKKDMVTQLKEEEGSPLDRLDLAINGYDIMIELNLDSGPEVGRLLKIATSTVLDDPSQNTKESLIKIIKENK